MQNYTIDNSVNGQNVILWQYDNAAHFCDMVELIEAQAKGATEDFWDYFTENVHGLFAAQTADDYGLALWGVFVGMGRPQLTVGTDTQTMSAELYRRVLGARIRLLMSSGSLRDISQYVADIFGENSGVTVRDLGGMAIEYAKSGTLQDAEFEALYALGEYWQYFPAGVRDNAMPDAKFFAFKGQHAAQTGTRITSGFGRSVYHPKTRAWRFYDDAGQEVDDGYSISGPVGVPVVLRTTGTVQDEVTWTLKQGSGTDAKTATQTGRKASVWSDYGVYFPKGSSTTDDEFPSEGITARWE